LDDMVKSCFIAFAAGAATEWVLLMLWALSLLAGIGEALPGRLPAVKLRRSES